MSSIVAKEQEKAEGTGFKGAHQGLRPGEIHRSLGMSNAGECKGDQSRPHHARGTE